MPDQADARAQAEALVDDYERVISDAVLEREYLIEAILAYGTAQQAAGREAAVTVAQDVNDRLTLIRVRYELPESADTEIAHAQKALKALRPAPAGAPAAGGGEAGHSWPTTPAAATPEAAVAAMPQTPPGREEATQAAILAQVALLERWASECFPTDPDGKVHFARAVMESAAEQIRAALAAPAPGREGAR